MWTNWLAETQCSLDRPLLRNWPTIIRLLCHTCGKTSLKVEYTQYIYNIYTTYTKYTQQYNMYPNIIRLLWRTCGKTLLKAEYTQKLRWSIKPFCLFIDHNCDTLKVESASILTQSTKHKIPTSIRRASASMINSVKKMIFSHGNSL